MPGLIPSANFNVPELINVNCCVLVRAIASILSLPDAFTFVLHFQIISPRSGRPEHPGRKRRATGGATFIIGGSAVVQHVAAAACSFVSFRLWLKMIRR